MQKLIIYHIRNSVFFFFFFKPYHIPACHLTEVIITRSLIGYIFFYMHGIEFLFIYDHLTMLFGLNILLRTSHPDKIYIYPRKKKGHVVYNLQRPSFLSDFYPLVRTE
jgi:hypothetical protein